MKLLLFLTICLFSLSLKAQKIDGYVRDSSGRPIPELDIFISENQGALADIVTSNNDGYFTVKLTHEGLYTIAVYDVTGPVAQRQVNVRDSIRVDFILAKVATIDSIVVLGRKPLIVTQIDRIQYNVENSVVSSGTDAIEVLKMTPLVRVSEEGIGITGKSNVAVMLDDRMVNLAGSDLINYLRSIRAEDISKIEVITAPPAKYQAEGNSGLINIVLKKNRKSGWSGAVSAAYNQTTYAGGGSNATVNAKFKKVATTLKMRVYERNAQATEKINLEGANAINSSDLRKDTYKGLGANLNVDYAISKRVNCGIMYDLAATKSLLSITNNTGYFTNYNLDSILTTFSSHNNPSIVQTVNLFTDFMLDSNGRTLKFSGNHFLSRPENTVNFQTVSAITDYAVENTSLLDFKVASLQADYFGTEKWGTLEAGSKYTLFSNFSDVKYFNQHAGISTIDPGRSNQFDYKETNMAAYISATRKIGKKWTIKGGVRYEYSDVTGYSITTDSTTQFSYGAWFPSGYLSYEHNEKHSFNLNYTRRINRPNYSSLNPFRWYSNPYTYYTGNPLLQPSFSNNAELSYNFGGIFTASLYGQYTTNGFGRTVEINNQVEKVINYANYLDLLDVGVNINYYQSFTKWWEAYITLSGSYSTSSSSLESVLPQNGFSSYYSISNFFTLHEKKKIKAQLLFWQNLPSKQANSFSRQLNALSIGVRFPVLKERFLVNITANDLFMGTISRGELYFSNFTQTYNNYYDGRNLNISVTYTFGNKKIGESGRDVPFEDKYRAN